MLILVTVWLNGGPGCSSLEGFLQENGPFLWQYGTYLPVKNNWAWSNLTNVVWVEQPAGTGFSHVGSDGAPKDEIEVAAQFLGWFKNFMDTFALYVSATERHLYLSIADISIQPRSQGVHCWRVVRRILVSRLYCCSHRSDS